MYIVGGYIPSPSPCLVQLCSEMTGELCRMVVTGGRSGVEEGQARELDQTLFLVLELSPLVDELAGELPAPLLWPDCREAGERLAHSINRLLHNIRYVHTGDQPSSGSYN